MPRIFIHAETPGSLVRAEVVTLSEVDGIYAISCTGDGIDECPGDIAPGDTWSNFEDCVMEAVRHIANHEDRM
jgi:hypothetical protein